jgi:UDPglucose--hexose-1-phosphate uridylyltransferase
VKNPEYASTFVFTNDYPALLPEAEEPVADDSYLFTGIQVTGTSRVVCFSPRHDETFADLPVEGIRAVIDAWATETVTLGERYRWVQVFENKGALMGCSNAHPHGQIWAGSFLPNEPAKEEREQCAYHKEHGSVLLLDYVELEVARKERLVAMNDRWAALVPFWAVWPFELLILPRTHLHRMPDCTDADRDALAGLLSIVLRAYDRVFSVSFPYTMGWHGAPFMTDETGHWQLHAHVYPPLLRSASVKKFMVGYEMLSEPQRDLTAESAATVLRDLCAPSDR